MSVTIKTCSSGKSHTWSGVPTSLTGLDMLSFFSDQNSFDVRSIVGKRSVTMNLLTGSACFACSSIRAMAEAITTVPTPITSPSMIAITNTLSISLFYYHYHVLLKAQQQKKSIFWVAYFELNVEMIAGETNLETVMKQAVLLNKMANLIFEMAKELRESDPTLKRESLLESADGLQHYLNPSVSSPTKLTIH